MNKEDKKYFNLALEKAFSVAGFVAPRPAVGCVIIKNDKIVGVGATEPRPGRHAEQVALDEAAEKANGATLYCTLEPHHFKTIRPPCTELILQSKINRVIIGMIDCNSKETGKSVKLLEANGVQVEIVDDKQIKAKLELLYDGYNHFIKKSRPLVIAKWAMSLDGKITDYKGHSKWISNEISRQFVHKLRSCADVVATGSRTILVDNPNLTARNSNNLPTGKPKYRVVIDTHLESDSNSNVFKSEGASIVFTIENDKNRLKNFNDKVNNCKIISTCKDKQGRVDIMQVLEYLSQLQVHKIMFEAGETLTGSLLEENLLDKVYVFIAPKLLGGITSKTPLGGKGKFLEQACKIHNLQTKKLGDDLLLYGLVGQRV